MSNSKFPFLLFGCFLILLDTPQSQEALGGTCAIVHRNHLGIFVGIDSKVKNTGNLPQSGLECKLKTKSGIIFFGDGSIRLKPIYDSYNIASSVISKGIPLRKIVSSFVDSVLSLAQLLKNAHDANPMRFDSFFVDNNLFNFTFIKYEQDSIYFALCEFKSDASSSQNFIIHEITYGADMPKPTMLYGFRDTILQEMYKAQTNTLSKKQTVSQLRFEMERLIKLQAKQTPDYVAGPIQIIWMQKNGSIRWLKSSHPCRSIIN